MAFSLRSVYFDKLHVSRSVSSCNIFQSVRLASKWKFWKNDSKKEEELEPISELDQHNQLHEEYRRSVEAEELQLKRNKSRLSASHRQMLHGDAPNVGVRFAYSAHHNSLEYKREIMGTYGAKQTGVDPGICWPSDQHLDLAREWEKLYMEKPLKQQIDDVKVAITKRKDDRIAREKLVDESLERMDNQIKQWRNRVSSKNVQAEMLRARREKVLAELREEFGYNVNPEDNYMKERIAEREKAIMKEEKEAKKAAKKEKFGDKAKV